MASILDKYGIKEVCDITFYKIGDGGVPTVPVLYIDSAKASTAEFTADEVTANGGKGNPALISWDSNKDINVTLEDALFSAKSMAIMFGDGTIKTVNGDKLIMKTEVFTCSKNGEGLSTYTGPDGKTYTIQNPKYYDENSQVIEAAKLVAGTKYFCSYDLSMEDVSIIEVGPNTFPGTYYVTADTYARSETTGEDEFFQLIFPKAKVKSENTLTMEADGDPTVFNMDLHILKPANNRPMVQLVKYSLAGGGDAAEADAVLVHNHSLLGTNSAG